jgi:hypothetical protein
VGRLRTLDEAAFMRSTRTPTERRVLLALSVLVALAAVIAATAWLIDAVLIDRSLPLLP